MSWEELVRLSEDIASSPLVPEISSDVQISLQYTTMMYTIYVLHVTYQELVRLSEDIVSYPLALVPEISSDVQISLQCTAVLYNVKVTCYMLYVLCITTRSW